MSIQFLTFSNSVTLFESDLPSEIVHLDDHRVHPF